MDDINFNDENLIPFLGMGVFKNLKCKDGSTLPHDNDSFILALNNGRAMSERLMYEYTRAAMSIEQRKGREYLKAMVNHIFTSREYALCDIYKKIQQQKPKYIVDTNLDDSILKAYSDVPHFLVTGVSRIMGGYDRFLVYEYENGEYKKIDKESLCDTKPIIFKPMGGVTPEKNFIVSDADFVDWLTEAMGGYGVPPFLKEYRKDKSYLFLGVDFSRDTFRMVANEITIGLKGGFIVDEKDERSKKEIKFAKTHNLEFIKKDCDTFLKELI